MIPRAAMILAAGFGTRMGALTQDRPKPLIHVGERTLIDHAIAAAGSCDPIVVNGHYRAEMLRNHLATHHPHTRFSWEQPNILDSGGAIKHALPLLGADPILTLNADNVWAGPLPHTVLNQHWDRTMMDALMLLVPPDHAVGRKGGGDVALSPDGCLSWNRADNGLVYTGAQILTTGLIAGWPTRVFSLRDVWQKMMDAGRVYGCFYPGFWADVGHPDGISLAEAMPKHAV